MSSGFWIIPMTICVIFMIVMIIFFIRRGGMGPGKFMNSGNNASRNEDTESPLNIIKKRYANGEISKAEYDQLKNDLI